jgi:hypothetical protein
LTVGNLNTGGGDVSLTAGTTDVGDLSAQNVLTGGSGNITLQATNAAGGDVTLAALDAGTGAVNVTSVAGSILDRNGAANNITGGTINLSAGGLAGINLDVIADTPATAGVTATATNAPIVLRSTSQLQVDSINAGAMGDVTLTVNNADTATSSITSLHPNDGIADVTGRTVTLTATGLSNGATGQIGFFTTSAQFFEVSATTINASTNNSRLWISAIGGAALGSINAGTDFAILQTVNGDLTSTHTGSTPDITAGTVILQEPGIAESFGFGSASNPLLVQTGTLKASVADAGWINVTNVAAGGDLNVDSATTNGGNINIAVQGGNLTTTATSGTDIRLAGGILTLKASGAVLSGTPSGVRDVDGDNLAITAGSGIGTSANPLKTALAGALAASVGNGGVFVTNVQGLDIDTVNGVSGITATGGNISITTGNGLMVSQPVSTTDVVTLTAGTMASGTGAIEIDINASITGSSATIFGGALDQGGALNQTFFTVTTLSATPLHIDGLAPTNTLIFDGQGQHAVGTIPGKLTR